MSGAVRLRGRQRGRVDIRGGRHHHRHGRGDGGRELDGGRAGGGAGQARPLPLLVRPHAVRLTSAAQPRWGIAGRLSSAVVS